MKKYCILSLIITISFLYLISCNRSNDIFIYSPPDTSSTPPQPYTIKVSKYYDSLFVNFFVTQQVQDFDIYGDILYLWVYGPIGLFEYQLDSKILTHIGAYSSGDCIAADSGRVYWAWFGEPDVNVFTLHNSQSSTFIPRSARPSHYVMGLQINNNKLYVLYRSYDYSPEENLLDVYYQTGELKESISYPRNTGYMAINRGILYSVAYDTVQKEQILSRFELSSGQFLKDVENPSLDCDGIRSYGDYFFFTDYEKGMIGYIPLDEIEQRGK